MKVRLSRILSLVLAAVVAFGMIGIGTFNTYAASKWKLASVSLWAGNYGYFYVYDENSEEMTEATITSLKSSNTGVISIKKEKYDGEVYFSTTCKKAGKVKITAKYKTPAGKTGTVAGTFRVKKYPYEIKSLAVNGKTVNTKKNKYQFSCNSKSTSAKVKVALKKGWKLDRVYAAYYDKNWNYHKTKVTKKQVKSGTKISFPKKYRELSVTLSLWNGKDSIEYTIFVDRP